MAPNTLGGGAGGTSAMMIGQTIGPFTLDAELGSGAMGTVYKARMKRDDGRVVPVALKVVSFGLLGNEGAMARFDRESAILKQLKHPHIVRLYGTGKHRGTPFIAMEYIDGESLDKILARRRRIDWDVVVSYGKHLCDALQHAHDKGIIHRDLKPSNLMVTQDGVLKLTDFGIAKDTDVTALTGQNSTIGTAAYMSPEQCRGDKALGPKSDLYSLGVCIYELLTGVKPFVAENTVEMFLKHVNETPVRPRRLVPDVPVWMDNLVMFCLEKNKENRPLDAATVGKMLEEITQKVANQQSVGADVANARRADRPISDGPLAGDDLAAARSLRGEPSGVRKKSQKQAKKAAARRKQNLISALVFGVPLLAILGGVGFVALPALFRTEPPEVALKRLADAPGLEDKLSLAAGIVGKYAGTPPADEARAEVRAAAARVHGAALLKRLGSAFEAKPEPYEPEPYKLALAALRAEEAGKLGEALAAWRQLLNRFPPDPLAAVPDIDELRPLATSFVAEWHARLLKDDVPGLLRQAAEAVRLERLNERDPDAAGPDAALKRAVRLEELQDWPKAESAYSSLAGSAGDDPAQRATRLVARQGAERLRGKPPLDDAARRTLLAKLLDGAEDRLKSADAAPSPEAERREARNACRDVISCYADDLDAQQAVARARALLDANPKR